MIHTVPNNGRFQMVAIEKIRVDTQIRTRNGFEEEGLQELSESIKQWGILQALVIGAADETGTHRLIAGERRILAASMAGLTEVPAMIRDETDAELQCMQAVENLQREDLGLADVVEGLASLYEQHKSWREVARKIGKSPAWVSKRRALTRLRPIARALMDAGISTDPELILALNNIEKANQKKAAELAQKLERNEIGREQVRAAWEAMKPGKTNEAGEGDEGEGEGEAPGEGEQGEAQEAPAKPLSLKLDAEKLAYLRHELRESCSPCPTRDALLAHLDAMFKAL